MEGLDVGNKAYEHRVAEHSLRGGAKTEGDDEVTEGLAGEVTAAALCPRGRKIFVGYGSGRVVAMSLALDSVVATYAPHLERVVDLHYLGPKHEVLVTVGGDRTIAAHDGTVRCGDEDKQTAEMNRRRRYRFVHGAHDAAITLSAVDGDLGLLATAAPDLTVRVWEVATLRMLSLALVPEGREVGALSFLDGFPGLCAALSDSTIKVYAIRGHGKAAASPELPLLAELVPGGAGKG